MTKHRNGSVAFQVAVLVSVLLIALTGQGTSADIAAISALSSPSDALAAAMRYTGLERSRGYQLPQSASDITSLKVFRDSTTPFVADSIDGRRAWCIRIENITFDTVTPKVFCPARDFEIWIDSASGRLLQIVSALDSPLYRMYPQPSVGSIEFDMGMSREVYKGIPDEFPAVDAITALTKPKWRYPNAGRIVMNYLMYSIAGSEAKPAWSIVYRGIRPSLAESKAQEPSYSNWRYIVNARTGSVIISTNYPSPAGSEPLDTVGD